MATVRGAFTALATFAGTVPGMTHSYDLDGIPDSVGREQLPCAIVMPESLEAASTAFLGNAYREVFNIQQLVLYAESEHVPYRKILPALIAFWDTYMATLKLVPYLVTATPGAPLPIHSAAVPKVVFGPQEWGGDQYHGFLITFVGLKIEL